MTKPRLLVLFNQPTLPADHPDAESEHDILYTADVVCKALYDAGAEVARHGVVDDPQAVIDGIKKYTPDAVFNLYEGTAKWGTAEAYVAGILELLRVPFTGCPTPALMLARNKPLTKCVLRGAGLPTAEGFVVEELPCPQNTLGWPLIVKPATEDASIGIAQASVVATQAELEARVQYIWDTYGGPVLVERFIRGREFNVPVWDRGDGPKTLPYSEILFPDDSVHPILSFDAKWNPESPDYQKTPAVNPANVAPELRKAVDESAVACFHLLGCRDYARVDYRIDESGKPYILEVNPNPCISPEAGLAEGLKSAVVSHEEFIVGVAQAALRRGSKPELAGLLVAVPAPPPPEPAAAAETAG